MEEYAIKRPKGREKKQGRSYKHLTADEREEIAIGLERGNSLSKIAKRTGRSPSTISREVRRNKPSVYNCRYRANRAQVQQRVDLIKEDPGCGVSPRQSKTPQEKYATFGLPIPHTKVSYML